MSRLAWCVPLLLAACASSNGDAAADAAADVTSFDATSPDATSPDATSPDAALPDAQADAADAACTAVALTVTPVRGALVFALDRSASMAANDRLATAIEGITSALSDAPFDALAVGAELFPASAVTPPACYAPTGVTEVGCGLAAAPALAPTVLGPAAQSTPGSVRARLRQAVLSQGLASDIADGTPLYGALQGSYAAARAATADRRAVLVVTDGNGSCASLASPARPGYFDGYCNDWEEPGSIVDLIGAAASDAAQPVATYVLGVVGSASHGEAVGGYTTAPYAMALALSAYAAAGAPDDTPTGCDAERAFTLDGAAPARPCHIDLAAPGDYSADRVAAAVADLEARAFACRFGLTGPSGAVSDDEALSVTVDHGAGAVPIRHGTGSADACADGCWELRQGELRLRGPACDAARTAPAVTVGCP